ncbi:diguanylate cyclase [Synechococcales cyanobacterium C]|uniref:Diguanylate cyclase n=1 Tax=Petrachloros mirabilis ULC683 TaxID=2781853 RepID=A0A8K2A8S6_9CYAN|nr:PleD family two-component system response regulator [Petrachloros mirabilis]NCJ08376.1 diguanylate cyclase [Petrachloros mirabilis ULC683]
MSLPSAQLLASLPLVLVIDDDLLMRSLLRRALEQEPYRVEEAENGEEGLEKFKVLSPDVVLLDAVMPDMSGFELCDQLQRMPRGTETPILMITGLTDEASVDRAYESGAIDYVTKPINWAVLRQRLRHLLLQVQERQRLEGLNSELRRLAAVDELTQVANRRAFDESLTQHWRSGLRGGEPLSLILCDIDYFKPYNDTYGHPAGDDCLKKVAQTLAQTVGRPTDLVARYGGEEFGILLPSTPFPGAVQVANKICEAVRSQHLPHQASMISEGVTLSCGVASLLPTPNETAEKLIVLADQALYQAKQQGRDRVVGLPPTPKV